jgi:hypothetical protein
MHMIQSNLYIKRLSNERQSLVTVFSKDLDVVNEIKSSPDSCQIANSYYLVLLPFYMIQLQELHSLHSYQNTEIPTMVGDKLTSNIM